MQYSRLHSLPASKRKTSKKRNLNRIVFRGVLTLLVVALSVFGVIYRHASKPSDLNLNGKVEAAAITAELAPSQYVMSSVALPQNGQAAIAVSEETLNIHTNSTNVWPMASITKIITALAILKKAPLEPGQTGETYILNQKDEQYYWDYAAKQGTITPVTAGLEMNMYEVLQTMLLASSNNMTDSLVDRYFANHDEFVTYTNDMLRSYGLVHTKVADASGFSPESVSTPSEMIKIGQIALKNPVIAEVVRQPNARPRVAGWIPNYNALINQPGVTGLKPGMTDQSGYNLLFSFEAPNKNGETTTVIGVVMGMFNRSEYMQSLMSMLESSKATLSTQ